MKQPKDAGLGKNVLSEMTDDHFMTAKLKARVARDFELFILARLKLTREASAHLRGTDWGTEAIPQFTKALYHYFEGHLGFIAHGDIHGFFHNQFLLTEDFLRNIRRMADNKDGIGAPLTRGWGANDQYNDLGEVLVKIAQHYWPYVAQLAKEERDADHASTVESSKRLLEQEGYAVTKS